MMRHILTVAFCIGLTITNMATAAVTFPVQKSTKVDERQYGYTTVHHDGAGHFRVVTMFSNGERLEGDYLCAETAVVSIENELLVRVRQRVGVDRSVGWQPNKKTVTDKFDLLEGQMTRVAAIETVHYSCKSQDEAKIWKTATAIVSEIIKDHGGEVTKRPETRLPRERMGLF